MTKLQSKQFSYVDLLNYFTCVPISQSSVDAPSACNFTSAHLTILTTSLLKSGSADTDLIETA